MAQIVLHVVLAAVVRGFSSVEEDVRKYLLLLALLFFAGMFELGKKVIQRVFETLHLFVERRFDDVVKGIKSGKRSKGAKDDTDETK